MFSFLESRNEELAEFSTVNAFMSSETILTQTIVSAQNRHFTILAHWTKKHASFLFSLQQHPVRLDVVPKTYYIYYAPCHLEITTGKSNCEWRDERTIHLAGMINNVIEDWVYFQFSFGLSKPEFVQYL